MAQDETLGHVGSVERAEKDWGVKARRDKAGRVISPPDSYFREDGEWRVMMAAYRRFMDEWYGERA